jgi:hypothetical protein
MSPEPFVAPDVLIDPFMGNTQRSFSFEVAADLLRAPFPSKTGPDELEILLAEVGISARQASSGSSTPLSLAGSVGTVGNVTAVAPELPVDGASMPVQGLGDLAHSETLQTKLPNAYSVPQGELLVNSHRCSLFGRKEKRLFWQLALLNSKSVALSI